MRNVFLIVALFSLTACATPRSALGPGEAFDPYEAQNRKMHAFNKAVDSALLRPKGPVKVGETKRVLTESVGNFADNMDLPSTIVNDLLQVNLKSFVMNTYRFSVNTVLGFGGLFDVASEFGIPKENTDFGETLYVWGIPEGAYVELPIVGPSTQRAAAGRVVDLFTNPLSYVLPKPEKYVGTAASVVSKVSDRRQHAGTVDSILYDSADSYAAARSIYLQNRRYDLGDQSAQGGQDPYSDPYEDPYAE